MSRDAYLEEGPATQPAPAFVTSFPEWTKRRFEAEDENALLYMWLKSYAHSAYGRARGADRDATPEERAYWHEQAPVAERLLRTCRVDVICDPERVRKSDAGPSVIWGFACVSESESYDTIHWIGVKRTVVRAGIGGDIVRDLLGTRLTEACGMSHELVELRKGINGVRVPHLWFPDPTSTARILIGSRAPIVEAA